MSDGESIRVAAVALVAFLKQHGLTVATAESCTGGMVAAAITSIAGASEVFSHGWITYSNQAKVRQLGVSESLFAPDGPGAVSQECVEAMASGAVSKSSADLAVAVSGIAGPTGGSESKPVGTVWFAVARADGARSKERIVFDTAEVPEDQIRDYVRLRATVWALELLAETAK